MRWLRILLVLLPVPLAVALSEAGLINPYHQQVLMYVGINVILTASLNIGAYVASIMTVWVFPRDWGPVIFPVAVIAGGLAAAVAGLVVAIPSFKARGDYLAIVTLAFGMIVKSALENIEAVGGPRGLMGMARLTDLA